MNTVKLFFLLLFVTFFSCQAPVEKKPDNLIKKEKFKQMVIDLHLLEAYVENKYTKSDSAQSIYLKLEEDYFEKNEFKKDIYLKTYNFYLRNSYTDMDPFYEEIVNELSKLEARTKGEVKK